VNNGKNRSNYCSGKPNGLCVFNANHWTMGLIMEDHKVYLSYSTDRRWVLINQGSPLCDYKQNLKDVMQVVDFYKIKLPHVFYDADVGQWSDMKNAKD
jgi:hypothetical protein